MGGVNTLTPNEPRPRVTSTRRHLGVPVRPCHPQSGGSATLFIAKISDVRWTVEPLRPSDALKTNHGTPNGKRRPSMQGVPMQLGKPRPVVVPSSGHKLSNFLPSFVREVCLPVHVLNSTEAECYQFVSHSHGEIREHQGFHEAVWSHAASAGFYEPRHCVVSRQAGYSPEQSFLRLSISTTSGFDRRNVPERKSVRHARGQHSYCNQATAIAQGPLRRAG